MESYIALLRGVNVGGNHKLPMLTLAEMCAQHGCQSVKTYIQSGNVVFQAKTKIAETFPNAIEAEIERRFGFTAPVIMRSLPELRAVAENNPFLKPEVDTKFLHVLFLADTPVLTDVVALTPSCVGKEAFSLRGREIYFYLPNGVGNSKLAAYDFGKKLRTSVTTRNWQTVTKLIALAAV